MLDDLQGQALLGPVRGEPPVDRDAVAAVLLALLAARRRAADVTSVDVNPLVVDASGTRSRSTRSWRSRVTPRIDPRRFDALFEPRGVRRRRRLQPPGQVRLRRAAQHAHARATRVPSTR